MKRKAKRWIIVISAVIILIIVLGILLSSAKKGNTSIKTVKVERKNIVDKALAVGSIEPLNEISVKSKISGVVGKLYVNVGDFVKKDDPLLEVQPDPTPLELVQAKRDVEMAKINLEALEQKLKRNKKLKDDGLISQQEFETVTRDYDEAALRYTMAKEELDLLEKGKVTIGKANIESVIKAPITGFILEKSVNVGDPVVPLTSYQAGTELLRMADMKKLLFRGTVDEIDVGRIKEEMTAELEIGALPGKKVKGHVTRISLKAKKEENSTVFPIEIAIDEAGGAVLRAGFSANANIIIAKKDSVLAIPERVVTFRKDSTFVKVPVGKNQSKDIYIKTGLSDAINIEVISGLKQGQEVLEKKVKEII